jgi:hypothetical protein
MEERSVTLHASRPDLPADGPLRPGTDRLPLCHRVAARCGLGRCRTRARPTGYRLMGRYDDALTDFNQAIELASESDWALAHRGHIHRLMGHYDQH